MKTLILIIATAFLCSNEVNAVGFMQYVRQIERVFAEPIQLAEQDIMDDFLDKEQFYGAEDRDEQNICSAMLATFEDSIREYYPFDFECTCRLRFRGLTLNCNTEVCVDDVAGLMSIDDSFVPPLANRVCVNAYYTGLLKLRGMELSSTLCTSSSGLSIDLASLEEQLGGLNLFDQDEVSFDTPLICTSLDHRWDDITAVESCAVTIDDKDCPCELCGDEGKDFQLQCPELIESYLPEVLRPFASWTTECIGIGMIENIFGDFGDDQDMDNGNEGGSTETEGGQEDDPTPDDSETADETVEEEDFAGEQETNSAEGDETDADEDQNVADDAVDPSTGGETEEMGDDSSAGEPGGVQENSETEESTEGGAETSTSPVSESENGMERVEDNEPGAGTD